MKKLAPIYESMTGFSIKISSASTGKLYAQIRSGAPYDVFLSADGKRPERLVDEELGMRESLRTYATGRLVVVGNLDPPAAKTDLDGDPDRDPCDRFFLSDEVKYLAIANPRTAPYGLAAKQTLRKIGAWEQVGAKLVQGENISQTFQFVESGNAQAGFVSRSQLHSYAGDNIAGCRWDVPEDWHEPIEQKMVVLKRSAESPAVKAFEKFMAGNTAASIIKEFGYKL